MDVYQELNGILREIATIASSSAAYEKWSDEFSRKEIREVWKDENAPLRRARMVRFTRKQIMSLNDDELNSLGFAKWDGSGLRLIPLWVFNYIADGEALRCIDNSDHVKGVDEIDNDHRGGAMAYGFMPPS